MTHPEPCTRIVHLLNDEDLATNSNTQPRGSNNRNGEAYCRGCLLLDDLSAALRHSPAVEGATRNITRYLLGLQEGAMRTARYWMIHVDTLYRLTFGVGGGGYSDCSEVRRSLYLPFTNLSPQEVAGDIACIAASLGCLDDAVARYIAWYSIARFIEQNTLGC